MTPTELGDLGDIEAQLELARETPTADASDSKKRNWLMFTAAHVWLGHFGEFCDCAYGNRRKPTSKSRWLKYPTR